jgi:hypothetical protein
VSDEPHDLVRGEAQRHGATTFNAPVWQHLERGEERGLSQTFALRAGSGQLRSVAIYFLDELMAAAPARVHFACVSITASPSA